MSLPKLAQAIEDTPRYKKWLASICLVAGLVGFGFDVGQRRSNDQTNRQLLEDVSASLKKTDNLVDQTKVLVTNTNEMVSRLGLMQPQITVTTDLLAKIDKKINVAIKEKNTEQVATLQAEKGAALSALLAMAPGIVAEMIYWANKWDMDDRVWDTRIRMEQGKFLPPQDFERVVGPLKKAREDMDNDHTRQILPIVTGANYIREQLLHGSELTQDDKKNALIFAKVLAGETIHWNEMRSITTYMDSLVRRLVPNPTVH
jgi:hypothetical protein